jgi:hypothetical protein
MRHWVDRGGGQLSLLFLLILFVLNVNAQGPQNLNAGQDSVLFTGTGTNPFYGVNLVPFGPENGDLEVAPGFLTGGMTIDLHMFFPFYGGKLGCCNF